jgi:hypothetical protein
MKEKDRAYKNMGIFRIAVWQDGQTGEMKEQLQQKRLCMLSGKETWLPVRKILVKEDDKFMVSDLDPKE